MKILTFIRFDGPKFNLDTLLETKHGRGLEGKGPNKVDLQVEQVNKGNNLQKNLFLIS